MKVFKFGGTSVANAENIKKVKQIVAEANTDRLAVVVSALGGCTDLLVNTLSIASKGDKGFRNILREIEDRHMATIKALFKVTDQSRVLSHVKSELNVLETLLEGAFFIGEATPKLTDKVLGYGELLSSYIISNYFQAEGLDTVLKDGRALITTDDHFGNAAVDFKKTHENCVRFFSATSAGIIIIPGFVAAAEDGTATTLGRGGSDYTAAIIAGLVNAEELQIWTDVSGMYTANPRIVKQAKYIPEISYEEAMELSHFGAKVLYPPTIQPVLGKKIPIRIKNTFSPDDAGTLITNNPNERDTKIRGISHIGGITLASLEGTGMVGIPGISKRLFETLSQEGISVVLITQASSEHSICLGIADRDAALAEKTINQTFAYEIASNKINPVVMETNLAIVALVGDNMKSYQGLSGKMFSALGRNNVNIRAIAQGASERNISAVIADHDVKKALNSLHETFFEVAIKPLNLFVMGVGNVGSKFLAQIQQQTEFLKRELKLSLKVVGISNSRKMVFDARGIEIGDWKERLENGQTAHLDNFMGQVFKMNLRNSIFIDNTANVEVANTYGAYLKRSISVVTCNKIACSSAYDLYQNLKYLSKKYNASFLFETNVGAGLPIIDTLKHLIVSGDRVHKVQAVLSGSLNFVFNNFSEQTTFKAVVEEAMQSGYTEPDPKIDLSGIDVMRKILILARESGYALNIEDITNDSFLPPESLETTTVEAFLDALEKHEAYFQNRYSEAAAKDCRLKYVAQFEDGKASVGLQHIPKGHDFYNLEGSDNIVLFYTDRYPKQPLVVKGAGAGADVTASGIFADIVRIGNL